MLVCICASKWSTTGNHITMSYWKASDCPLSFTYYTRVLLCSCVLATYWPQQGSMTELWALSDFHYTTGVYGLIWTAYIRQPLCVRLHRTRWQAAARGTSAVSHQEDEFGRCGRAHWASTIDLAGSGWMSGAMWVTGVKSACHRQLNGVLRHPAEAPSSEQKCDRKLWTENRAPTEAAASQRGERTGRSSLSCGDFISLSRK